MAMNNASHATLGRPARSTADRRRIVIGYLFVAPLLLWLAGAIVYPLISAIALSVQDIKIIGTTGTFVGLENYADRKSVV